MNGIWVFMKSYFNNFKNCKVNKHVSKSDKMVRKIEYKSWTYECVFIYL